MLISDIVLGVACFTVNVVRSLPKVVHSVIGAVAFGNFDFLAPIFCSDINFSEPNIRASIQVVILWRMMI